jgi:P-type Ca2+ transporter type 2C
MTAPSAQRASSDASEPASGSSVRWHVRTIDEVLKELGHAGADGLSQAEAAQRLKVDGPNLLPEPPRDGPWRLFFAQFKSLVIVMLIVAGAVSAFLGETVDAVAILSIVLLNAIIGFYQEWSAEQSIAALRKLTAPMAKVRRNGEVRMIAAAEVVRGDRLEFEAGDVLPADARVIASDELSCIEAALTGESVAVRKQIAPLPQAEVPLGDRHNMVYLGTSVATGAGQAVVVATGRATEMGKIAGLMQGADRGEATPLQKRLNALGRTLVWVTLGLVTLLFGIGLLRGMPVFELLLTSISLAVAAAPEGLPAVVTVALGLGVQRMAKRRALVRRLPSVETLGSASVICTDKTGTLTVGEMTVQALCCAGENFVVEGIGLAPEGAVRRLPPAGENESSEKSPTPVSLTPEQQDRLSQLSRIQTATVTAQVYAEEGVWKVAGDPTEGALITVARKLTPATAGLRKVWAYPFDSTRKRASVVVENAAGEREVLVNGAPDVLLALCDRHLTPSGVVPLTPEARQVWEAANEAMAQQGLRVLGSAYKPLLSETSVAGQEKPAVSDIESNLIFAGLAGMLDPPRAEAADAIVRCQGAGIRVIMITGDHPATAMAIGKRLGIVRDGLGVLTGTELDALPPGGLDERVATTAVYARVSAEHKLRIIEAFKKRGDVVAMTGDGVNDAPALKGAHIGVAMGKAGTEVTKQASDMVLADDHFATIVAAVEEGRGIYQNIRNTLQFLLAGNVGELLLMTMALILGLPAPLLPIHLLWINLVTDGLPALCLAAENIDPDVMKGPPKKQTQILSDKRFLVSLMVTGLLTAGIAFGVFYWALPRLGLEEARSLAFASLVGSELLRSLGARSETKPIWRMRFFSNKALIAVVSASLILQVLGHQTVFFEAVLKTTALGLNEWGVLLALSLIPLLALEGLKVVWRPR